MGLERSSADDTTISPRTRPAVVRQHPIPEWMRALDTFDRTDYADMFTATAARTSDLPVEQWARVALQQGPQRVRLLLLGARFVQRALLGLPVDRGWDEDRMLGWRIAARDDNWVRLEATSRLMSGHIIMHREGRHVSAATFLRYNRRAAAFIWPPIAVVHRLVARFLVRYSATVG